MLFSDALKTAGELDAHFAATKELKGPLHGVPISFKDLSEFAYKLRSLGIVLTLVVVDIKGYDSSMGFSPWANKPAVADADVRLSWMRHFHRSDPFGRLSGRCAKQGASPWSKPTSLKAWRISNVRTPYGGRPGALTRRGTSLVGLAGERERFWPWAALSLGGEPILGGASGSHLISVGSTVSSQALAGSAYREQLVSDSIACQRKLDDLSALGIDPNPGFKNIPTVLGPMARTVEDIEIASRVAFGKSANYSSAPVPYREVKLGPKLKFGYYFNDGMARITPACRRAVSETVEALRGQGYECVEFELPHRAFPTRLPCASRSLLFASQPRKHPRHS